MPPSFRRTVIYRHMNYHIDRRIFVGGAAAI
jgi:hypothetical protein